MHAYFFQVELRRYAADFARPIPVIDLDGNDKITPSEFSIGMEKLMVPLDPDQVKKACSIVAGLHTENAGAEARRRAGTCTRAQPASAC